MARVVVCGAGAVGACIALELARLGVGRVVLAELERVGAGATGRAFGGVRQQFSTVEEVVLARESVSVFRELGAPLFEEVGYLFLASSAEGWSELQARIATQQAIGVPVRAVTPAHAVRLAPGLAVADVLGGAFCPLDGTAEPAEITREIVSRAVGAGVELREGVDGLAVEGDVHVIACGAFSAEVAARRGVELPLRPLVRQLLETAPLTPPPPRLPVVIEHESGFHFRRRGDVLRLAMGDPQPRWSFEQTVDASLLPDRLARLGRRYPPAAGAAEGRAWAGLYDMTPDAHPILGCVADGLWVACGFSGHGFMQAPAVGRAIAEEIVLGQSRLDLSPFRLERFAGGTPVPELAIL